MKRTVLLFMLMLLIGCAASPESRSGCIAYNPGIPFLFIAGRGCATQLTNRWAVSTKHEANLLPSNAILDPDYDLSFFPHDGVAPIWRDPVIGEEITAEGNPRTIMDNIAPLPMSTREKSSGHLLAIVDRFCPTYAILKCSPVVVSDFPIKPGYSGGPIMSKDGHIIGLIFAGTGKSIFYNGTYYPPGLAIAAPPSLVIQEFQRFVPDNLR